MIIVLSGLHGTGKSTIAMKLAEHFKFQFYATGNAFRELAKEHHMSLQEFSKYAEVHKEIDFELDAKIKKLAESGKSYVFDGQLPAYILGSLANYRILLQCDDEIRISRMKLRDNQSLEAQKQETFIREASERQRFIDLYHIDIQDPILIKKTYDFVVDTTNRTIDQVFALCLNQIKSIFPELK